MGKLLSKYTTHISYELSDGAGDLFIKWKAPWRYVRLMWDETGVNLSLEEAKELLQVLPAFIDTMEKCEEVE